MVHQVHHLFPTTGALNNNLNSWVSLSVQCVTRYQHICLANLSLLPTSLPLSHFRWHTLILKW